MAIDFIQPDLRFMPGRGGLVGAFDPAQQTGAPNALQLLAQMQPTPAASFPGQQPQAAPAQQAPQAAQPAARSLGPSMTPNAAPATPQAGGQQYMMGGGLGDFLRSNPTMISNLAAGLMSGSRGGVANAVASLPGAQQRDRQNAALKQWMGTLPEEQQGLARAFPQVAGQSALQAMFAPPKSTTDMANYQFAQDNPGFADFLKSGGSSGAPSYGLTPVWGTDAEGNTVLMQIGKNGEVIQSALPGGVTPMSPGELNAQKAGGTATGKAQGEAQVNLPAAEHNAQRMLYDIDQALSAAGLDSAVGPLQGRIPEWAQMDPKTIEARSRIRKIQADTFLAAFESLKGAGQITEFESQSAANALSRLSDTTLSDADYREALQEFRREVIALRDLARSRAQGGGGVAPQSSGNVRVIREITD